MIVDDDSAAPANKMRYRVRKHLNGAKFVQDAKTGRPAIVRWRLMIGMDNEQATKAADLLNRMATDEARETGA